MRLSIEVMAVGIIISFAVYKFVCVHMHYKPFLGRMPLRCIFMGIRYALILVYETIKANAIVFRIVFSRTIKVEPRLIFFRTVLQTNAALAALASSINLTPGTITVALSDGLFCVHCLNAKLAEGIEDSVFVRRLLEFEALVKERGKND